MIHRDLSGSQSLCSRSDPVLIKNLSVSLQIEPSKNFEIAKTDVHWSFLTAFPNISSVVSQDMKNK